MLLCMYACMHVCMYVSMFVFVYVYMYVCMYVFMYVQVMYKELSVCNLLLKTAKKKLIVEPGYTEVRSWCSCVVSFNLKRK